jgi:two-component system cell cycle sensor histidine kinase/response regulator CckA
VHGIVTQSGGTIGVTSEPDHGTTFQIAFPVAAEPSTEQTPRPSTPRTTTTRRSILLVEDDDQVRGSTAQMLRKLGHDVTEANGAAEALRAWRIGAERIDVIVTDVVMPEQSGPSLARDALSHHAARVLFISGYLHNAVDDELLRRAAFLGKPFTEQELRSKLDEIFAQPRMPKLSDHHETGR